MTSIIYNTFNDDEEILITQTQSSSLLQKPIRDHQCLICLQNSSNSKDEIKSINEMHFLKKTCNCICYSHHKCIESWIGTNSVCPICKKPLLFPETNNKSIKNETAVDISINNDEFHTYTHTHTYTHNHNHKNCIETAPMYMCIMVVVFSIVILGNLIITTQPL